MSDSEEEVSLDKQLKLVLVGDPCTGKTSIIRRYCHQEFSRQYFPTAGVDFFLKRITVHGKRDATIQLWDVGGSALDGKMLDKYIFGAHVVIYVIDVTSSSTLDNLGQWMQAVRTAQAKPVLCAVLGNKCDMEHQRVIRMDHQQRFASDHGFFSYVVSARTGENISLFFQKIAAELLGIKLTRAEQEEHQPVVKAEISDTHVPMVSDCVSGKRAQSMGAKSAVCILQ
ncbi:ras-related protein Rab-28-like [Thrips palmi]|uniref:Ras-related protein Rab-28-like n=1 Tax=Thrips palmi TaxID=161013 RepID=A0A6P9AF03_THRPL|nr:ras-related protein Rab-28-like [Thrips palmi]